MGEVRFGTNVRLVWREGPTIYMRSITKKYGTVGFEAAVSAYLSLLKGIHSLFVEWSSKRPLKVIKGYMIWFGSCSLMVPT